MIHDPALLKLGRPLRPVQDPRTLRFAAYLKRSLPAAPLKIDYGSKVKDFGMLANDQVGDCTCAGILHMIMLWASQFGHERHFTDEDAIALYSRLCGYVPGHPETDQGGVEIEILKAWRKSPIAGTEILAFASVDPRNWEHVKLAHWLGGSLYMGIALPLSAQDETIWQSTQDVPGGWGGHCTITSAYAEKGGFGCARYLECVTWGERKKMTPAWVAKYCDELWVPITPDWFGPDGKAPNGFNQAQLFDDLASVAQLAA
jgi:hypothetical protein